MKQGWWEGRKVQILISYSIMDLRGRSDECCIQNLSESLLDVGCSKVDPIFVIRNDPFPTREE